jgi:DNA-binding CsgD family transcriptional regulator
VVARRGRVHRPFWCRTIYAGVLTATGEWEQADRELEPTLRGYDELGGERRVYALGRLAELRVRQGRLGEAERLLDGHEDHRLAVPAAVGLALARGNAALACALVERRLEGADDAARAVLLPLCAQARLAAGDLDGADAATGVLEELAARLRRDNLAALAAFARGRIAVARGEDAAPRRSLGEALDAFRRLRMPLEEGRAQLALARLEEGELARRGARGALATFERLGAARDADEAAALLRALGVSGRSAPRLDGELTAREREVLALLGEGLSNRAIADRLYISPKTAEHHVGRILGKLGLRSRAEAAAHAARGGAG